MPTVGLLGIQEIYIRSFKGLRCIDTIFTLTILINIIVINHKLIGS